jgi:CheY-like chemotaxis protein
VLFLLIEDDDDKRAAVSAFLNASFPGCAMREARSFHSGLQELLLGRADVVILDMTMPTFDIGDGEDGGRPQAYAGRELMWHMRRDGIPTRVIVLTAFDRFGDGHEAQTLAELDKELGTSFGQQYLGAIQFNPTLDAWKRELKQLIEAVGEMESA